MTSISRIFATKIIKGASVFSLFFVKNYLTKHVPICRSIFQTQNAENNSTPVVFYLRFFNKCEKWNEENAKIYEYFFFLPCLFSSKLLVFPSFGNSSRTEAISLSGPLAGLLGLDLGPIVVGLSIDALGCVVVAIFDFVKLKN